MVDLNGKEVLEHAKECAAAYKAIGEKTPLVHCITNFVSMDIMANVLLAIKASPIMVGAETWRLRGDFRRFWFGGFRAENR